MPAKNPAIINVKNKIPAKSLENGVTVVSDKGSFTYLLYTNYEIILVKMMII